jgi:hypothetical protein
VIHPTRDRRPETAEEDQRSPEASAKSRTRLGDETERALPPATRAREFKGGPVKELHIVWRCGSDQAQTYFISLSSISSIEPFQSRTTMSNTQDKCDCDTPVEEKSMLCKDPALRRKSVDHFITEANVTLISSDNVEFRVWDYELKAGR